MEVRQVISLVGTPGLLPCLLSVDSNSASAERTPLVASERSQTAADARRTIRPRVDLNQTYDGVRLILFYKESIKSGPIYSIDNRFVQQLSQARHFAAEPFQGRLTVEGLGQLPIIEDSAGQVALQLRIDSLRAADAGDYKCRVDFRRGRTLTTHVHLKVIGKCFN